jgi:urea ABC transporter ATP-binding protein UrtE
MLTVNQLQVGYDDSIIIWDAEFTVDRGQIVAILGRNGSGKTTLLKGLLKHNTIFSGNVYINGKNTSLLDTHEIIAMGVGYVPQSRDIFPNMSVEDNIKLGSAGRADRFLENDAVDYVYDYFPVLKEISDKDAGVLSGGQKQQLAIARALNANPDLLLLDEPSEGVQPSIVEDIGTQLQKIADERDIGVLMVEQNLELALSIADYCNVLENGRIVEQGTPEELTEQNAIEKYLTI